MMMMKIFTVASPVAVSVTAVGQLQQPLVSVSFSRTISDELNFS